MTRRLPPSLEVWFSEEDGEILAAVFAVDLDGPKRLVGAERFGPFDELKDVAAWIWARLTLDTGAPLR
jgi:hypothetical protein